jgi:SAM-dependent methyltransferase
VTTATPASSSHTPEKGYERYLPAQPRWKRATAVGGSTASRLARGWRSRAMAPRGEGTPLELELVECDLCGTTAVEPVGVGEDFEHWTSPDSFLAVRCTQCDLVFLDPRPTSDELDRIHPRQHPADGVAPGGSGLVRGVRERVEARRIARWADELPTDATVVDIGCGDGFHLDLIRRHGPSGWTLVGVEPDLDAAERARARGLTVHATTLAEAPIEPGSADLVMLLHTIEHVPNPTEVLGQIAEILAPGGQLVVVTANLGSPDFSMFRSRHWGGWDWPRSWHLYSEATLTRTAEAAGLAVEEITTIASPDNWVSSVRNLLVDLDAPGWMIRPLSHDGAGAMAVGTLWDLPFALAGRGALLRGRFSRRD